MTINSFLMLKYCAITCSKGQKRAVAQRGAWQSPIFSSYTIGAFEAHIYADVRALPTDVCGADDLFVSPEFLKIMAQAASKNRSFGALIFQKQGQNVGFMPFQVYHFKAHDSLHLLADAPQWLDRLKYTLAKTLQFRTLIVGNLHTTGAHAYWFEAAECSEMTQKELITEGVALLKRYWAAQGQQIQAVFMKDFEKSQSFLIEQGFHEFQVEPHFSLSIPAHWQHFDDYLADLSSKYRVRAKRAFKKKNGLRVQQLSAADVARYETDMFALFQSVAQQSAFNLVDLEAAYFYTLKQVLGEKCLIIGYFHDDKMVGFCTLLQQGAATWEAHFLGYDATVNPHHQLYLNMLYDMVRLGIEQGAAVLHFGRTANEIKSSIGAIAQPMHLYYRPENRILRSLFPLIFKWLNPTLSDWQPRSPFKTTDIDAAIDAI